MNRTYKSATQRQAVSYSVADYKNGNGVLNCVYGNYSMIHNGFTNTVYNGYHATIVNGGRTR